jgi:proteasome lid subunit RPN8/RPN11
VIAVTLVIKAVDLERIIAQCQREAPLEACGVLAGTVQGAGRDVVKEVVTVYPCQNELQSSIEYRISPDEQIRVFSTIDEAGLRLVGFYHSHPHHSSRPSTLDEDRAHYYGHSYLIIALRPLHVSSWILRQQRTFQEERIVVRHPSP